MPVQPSGGSDRICKRLEAGSDPPRCALIKTCATEILRERQIKAEQVAAIDHNEHPNAR